MAEVHTKHLHKVIITHISSTSTSTFSRLDYAAENNATHGVPIDDFQQMILADHNKCRRQACANELQEDDELHREAMKRAHSLANGHLLPLPDDYNENVFELDTGDPSKITSE